MVLVASLTFDAGVHHLPHISSHTSKSDATVSQGSYFYLDELPRECCVPSAGVSSFSHLVLRVWYCLLYWLVQQLISHSELVVSIVLGFFPGFCEHLVLQLFDSEWFYACRFFLRVILTSSSKRSRHCSRRCERFCRVFSLVIVSKMSRSVNSCKSSSDASSLACFLVVTATI